MLKVAIGAVLTVAVAGQAQAQNAGLAPPGAGYDVLLDLAQGIGINNLTNPAPDFAGSYFQYTETFVATHGSSTITFAFRNDAGYFALDNVSAMDTTHSSGNLLTNGDFSAGPTGLAVPCPINNQKTACPDLNLPGPTVSPPGWKFAQDPAIANQNGQSGVYSALNGGILGLGPQGTSTQFWGDGSFYAYDTLAQTFATTPGDTYSISFWLANWSPAATTYQQLNTAPFGVPGPDGNGNAMDVRLLGPDPIPEPASIALVGLGLAGLGFVRRRRA